MSLLPRSVLARDALLGVAVTVVGELELLAVADELDGRNLWHHLVHLLIVPAFALRRRWPLGSVLVAAAGLVVNPLVGEAPVATAYLALLFLLASLGWYAALRAGLIGVAATLGCGLGYDVATGGTSAADAVVNAVLIVLPWGLTHGVRIATDRRIAAEVDADRRARAAVEAERTRIAQDLHDSLAHALTLMTLQAGSARERADQEVVARALGAIEDAGREALDDMHRFLGLLGPSDGEAPGIAHLPDLVDGVRRSGLAVDLDVAAVDVAPSVSTTVYRVVQEGLTNVARHSDARSASVRVHRHDGHLVTVVADDGSPREERATGGGRGLAGLRRRLELFDGDVAFRSTTRGATLEARIPLS